MKSNCKLLIILFFVLAYTQNAYATQSKEEESLLINEMDQVFSILEKFKKQADSGDTSEVDSKKMAIAEIGKIRFKGQNYFLIAELDGTIISHANPKLVGRRDLLTIKDPFGIPIIQKIIDIAANTKNGGFFTYHWYKPGNPTPIEKLSYSRLFKEWNWVLGTSIYTQTGERESYIEPITITLSIIELYNLNKGYYPKSLNDLSAIGKWVNAHLRNFNFQYKLNGNGYDLFLMNSSFPNGVKVLPETMKKGLGIRNNNIFNS